MELNVNRLGYTHKWRDLDILKDEEFKKQILEFEKGEDTNKEHYRYRTLCNWMDSETDFSTEKLRGIIEILKNDEDIVMATTAYFRLYSKDLISKEQKELLETKWINTNEKLNQLIDTYKIENKIMSGEISIDLFEDCIKRRKVTLLRMIIAYTENNMYLERLTTFEHSKKVRNLANEKMKRVNK